MAAFQPKLYRWEGYRYSVPAQTVGEVCEKLEEEYGEVTRQNLLDASRDKSSPTHDLFEWRDDVAAEQWRLRESSKVLQCLKFTIITHDEKERTQRAFVNVISKDTEGSYRSFDVAMTKKDLRAEVLKRALKELETFQAKYSELIELSAVFDAINSALNEFGGAA